jgi:hypothetical protein
MGKKLKSPAQLAMESEAWRQYHLAFERQGLPVPEMKVSPPRMQVFANGTCQTVFANGSRSALVTWATMKAQWAELTREMEANKAGTLLKDVWTRWNKERWK